MKRIFLEAIKADGVYGRFDLYHQFHSGVNIIYGVNGSGKTTLLHILANALNGDFWQFFFLPFSNIEIYISDSRTIRIKRYESRKFIKIEVKVIYPSSTPTLSIETIFSEILAKEFDDLQSLVSVSDSQGLGSLQNAYEIYNPTQKFIETIDQISKNFLRKELVNTIYIPAFRSSIDAIMERIDPSSETNQSWRITNIFREIYGKFVPYVKVYSIAEIQKRITENVMQNMYSILINLSSMSTTDNNKISKDTFPEKFPSAELRSIIENINELFQVNEYKTAEVNFNIRKNRNYSKSHQIKRSNSLSKVSDFLELINSFLVDKKIRILKQPINGNVLGIEYFPDLSTSQNRLLPFEYNLSTLSSGERQLVSIIYSLVYLPYPTGTSSVFLFDEPEISLHLDWKRKLLERLFTNEEQVLVCTHSTSIAADWIKEDTEELQFTPTSIKLEYESDDFFSDLRDNENEQPNF